MVVVGVVSNVILDGFVTVVVNVVVVIVLVELVEYDGVDSVALLIAVSLFCIIVSSSGNSNIDIFCVVIELVVSIGDVEFDMFVIVVDVKEVVDVFAVEVVIVDIVFVKLVVELGVVDMVVCIGEDSVALSITDIGVCSTLFCLIVSFVFRYSVSKFMKFWDEFFNPFSFDSCIVMFCVFVDVVVDIGDVVFDMFVIVMDVEVVEVVIVGIVTIKLVME